MIFSFASQEKNVHPLPGLLGCFCPTRQGFYFVIFVPPGRARERTTFPLNGSEILPFPVHHYESSRAWYKIIGIAEINRKPGKIANQDGSGRVTQN